MLKFIIFIVAAYIVYKLFIGDQKKKKHEQQKQREEMADKGLMIKDPVCGTYVSTESAIRVKSGETIHCFCSYECRDKYLARLETGRKDTKQAQ